MTAPAAAADHSRPRCFRLRLWFRAALVAVTASWIALLVSLAAHGLLEARLSIACAFFVALFGVLALAYQRTVIIVGREGLELRGLLGPQVIPFAEILRVDVVPGLLHQRYDVVSNRGVVRFTNLFQHHARLGALIAARAGGGA